MKNNTKIRKVLFNEISLMTGIVAIAVVVVLFIVGPDAQLKEDISLIHQDLNYIKTNHLKHIEDDIKEINIKNEKQDDILIKINESLVRIETLLDR